MRLLRFLTGILGLIIANLIPLYGVVFQGWSATDLMFCFWVESFVVGIFTMLKIAKYRDIFLLVFFPMHYGMFMLVHLIFLLVGASIGFFEVNALGDNWTPFLLHTGAFFIGCFGSHALSYFLNFIREQEWKKRTSAYYFLFPYGRIVPMHIAIILGAIFGIGPFILYSIKLAIDLIGYSVEHGFMNKGETQIVQNVS